MYDFQTVTDAPPADRFGNRVRNRTNPFDDKVRESYEENYEASDKWVSFTVPPNPDRTLKDQLKTVVGQIRAAGQYHKLGTEIRRNDETGQVWFRGTEKHDRGVRRKDDSNDESYFGSYTQ